MYKRIITKRNVLIALTVAMLLFIWGQSLLPRELSAEESGWFTTHIINPLLGLFGLSVKGALVRKLAHVTEYTILSILLTVLFRGNVKRVLPLGFAAAFLDESIQILSKRGAMIQDVWIDLLGVLIGYILTAVPMRLRRNRNSKQDQNDYSK
ncbi:MAG: VanZ family protein [Clostridia bacterium]|nr:VanZ family protein [Clostridia bacterium]